MQPDSNSLQQRETELNAIRAGLNELAARHDAASTVPMPKGVARWEFILPPKAEEMLAVGERQRKYVPAHGHFLAEQMEEGLWEHENPQPIIVDDKGNTIEGQHRLKAVIESGTGAWFLVVRNVPERVFEVVDTGRVRQARDLIGIQYKGVNSSALAAAARLLQRYENGQMSDRGHRVPPKSLKSFIQEKHPGLVRHLDAPKEFVSLLAAGPAAFAKYLFTRTDAASAMAFINDVGSGSTERGTPARELRERLLANRGARRKMHAEEKLAITIRAWNAMRQGRSIQVLQGWRIQKDKFPVAE
jgi:hypothetical protein